MGVSSDEGSKEDPVNEQSKKVLSRRQQFIDLSPLSLSLKPDLAISQLILLSRQVSSLHMFCRMSFLGGRRWHGVSVKMQQVFSASACRHSSDCDTACLVTGIYWPTLQFPRRWGFGKLKTWWWAEATAYRWIGLPVEPNNRFCLVVACFV